MDNSGRQLFELGLHVVEGLDFPRVIRLEVVASVSLGLTPLVSLLGSVQSFPPFGNLAHLFPFSIEVGKFREILTVIEANRDLIVLLFLRVTTVHEDALLSVLGAQFLSPGVIHETVKCVLLALLVAGEKAFALNHLQVVQEAVHD